jgi:L-rhamnose mutarotase
MGGDGKGVGAIVKRIAFKMKLKPGHVEEYKRRHDNIWPELVDEIRRDGTSDFSIFLDEETLTLFACQKVSDGSDPVAHAAKEVSIQWRDYMADILEVHPDNTAKCVPLLEMFHLE